MKIFIEGKNESMYLALVFFLVCLFSILVMVFKKEILAPAVVVVLMFSFSSVIGIVRWKDWKLSDYSFRSVMLLVLAILCFVIPSVVIRNVYNKRGRRVITQPVHRTRINIDTKIIGVFVFLGVLTNILYYRIIYKIVGGLGFSVTSLSVVINHYRNISSLDIFNDMYHIGQ